MLSEFDDSRPYKALQFGVVFDAPLDVVGFDANHSWAFIDTLYFATVPEPGTALLLAAGLALLASRARRPA